MSTLTIHATAARSGALGLLVMLAVLAGPASAQERACFEGHVREVNAVAYSPDGAWIATADDAGVIAILASADATPARTIAAHAGDAVTALAWSADGALVASASRTSGVALWNPHDGTAAGALAAPPAARPDPHAGEYTALAFAPDGRTLAGGTWSGAIHLWDVASRTPRRALAVGDGAGAVRALIFGPDSGRLYAGVTHATQSVVVWDLAQADARTVLPGPEGVATALAMSRDGTRLAVAGEHGRVRILALGTGALERAYDAHQGLVLAVAFHPAGAWVASGGVDGKVALWDVATGASKLALPGHDGFVRTLAFAPDGATLVSGGDDKRVRLWSLSTKERLVAVIAAKHRETTTVAFSPDGARLVTSGRGDACRTWDVAKQVEANEVLGTCGPAVFGVDGTWACGTPDGTLKAYDADDQELWESKGKEYFDAIAFTRDGKRLLVPASRRLLVLDAATGKPAGEVPYDLDAIRAIAVHADGKRVAVGSKDWRVAVLDLEAMKVTTIAKPRRSPITAMALSPDGRTLACGTEGGEVVFLELDTLAERAVYPFEAEGQTASVGCLAYAPDGSSLAVGGLTRDRPLRLLDAGTRKVFAAMNEGHKWGQVRTLAFSPDGKRLASGAGTEVCLWDPVR